MKQLLTASIIALSCRLCVAIISCPRPGKLLNFTSTQKLEIRRSTKTNQVCIVSLVTPDHELVPAGRSYRKRNWEASPGPFASKLKFNCTSEFCSVDLPLKYVVYSYERNVTKFDEASRFLEQATFGPKLSEIKDLAGSSLENWTYQQIYKQNASSHREHFRTRVNARKSIVSIETLTPSDKPCDVKSKWINYAFSWEKCHADVKFKLSALKRNTNWFSITDDKNNRITEVPVANWNFSTGIYFSCCYAEEKASGKLAIKFGGDCIQVAAGNPLIQFRETLPNNWMRLPNNTLFTNVFSETSEMLLLERIDPTSCNTLRNSTGLPVHAMSADNTTWIMHDPRILLMKNTIEKPAACSVTPRTFLNSEACQMALENVTCVPGDDIVFREVGDMICGSPGEIANNRSARDEFDMVMDYFDKSANIESFDSQKFSVWSTVVLNAGDQLRQRMAWALSQIIALAVGTPGAVGNSEETEIYLNFYDIFVRHAFGNYRDILKEIAYSPLMGKMLSYLNNRPQGYNSNPNIFPDENFAREIMQLFSIGLYRLNMNGTQVILPDGTIEQTYTIIDVMENARAWTGFNRQPPRKNFETLYDETNRGPNNIDPMRIITDQRDHMPKTDINGGYIGDRFPLCVDAQDKHFLKQGARYRLLGRNPKPDFHSEARRAFWKHLSLLNRTSTLYKKLCDSTIKNTCSFKAEVILDANVECDGFECDIEQPRVVVLEDQNVYYEYVRPPCVQFPFFNGAKKIKQKGSSSNYEILNESMCADPLLPAAEVACCQDSIQSGAWRNCAYTAERVSFSKARSRCDSLSSSSKIYDTCSWQYMMNAAGCGDQCCLYSGWYWSDVQCNILAKVDALGQVAIIHNHTDWDPTINNYRGYITEKFSPENMHFFRVHWFSDSYPSIKDSTCIGQCMPSPYDDSCICRVTIKEIPVFQRLPSAEEAVKHLKIGGFPVGSPNCTKVASNSQVIAWNCNGSNSVDNNTVFEVSQKYGPTLYLKNTNSWVSINNNNFQFRNPPHFINQWEPTLRDVLYETDAVLDQLFFHPNTAPFLSFRLIQRFGISNPSPTYLEAVSVAFAKGIYKQPGGTNSYGTGKYGDLAATVSAILLHPEATSAELDGDPSYGAVREPLLRVIHLMRSLEFKVNSALTPNVKLMRMDEKIGQMAHAIPSVFSFFSPDFTPQGRINHASLVSPEAAMTNTPLIFGLLNGMFSLIKSKLSSCNNGFGPSSVGCESNMGALTYKPSKTNDTDTALIELNILLTAGRVPANAIEVIKKAMMSADVASFDKQLEIAVQLFVTTPEFNTRGIVNRGEERTKPSKPQAVTGEHKSIVFFFMSGGVDSYNLLVPDSDECAGLYNKYANIRDTMKMTNEELTDPFSAGGAQSSCNSFRLHKDAQAVADLYKNGEVLFLANTGVLLEPVTKENWEEKHRKTMLFAHDKQQRETKMMDPFKQASGTGVLGRMTDSLTRNGYSIGSYAIEAGQEALCGDENVSPTIRFVENSGPKKFDPEPSSDMMRPAIEKLNNNTIQYNSSMFGELWSSTVFTALAENDILIETLKGINLDGDKTFAGVRLSTTRKLETVAKLIKVHNQRGTNRDVFFVELPAWDVHDDAKSRTSEKLIESTTAFSGFVKEMKAQGRWEDTVVIMLSEFGRSLTPNSSGGCDHGWGGNYWVAGGAINGGKILGTYPSDFEELNTSRMRLLPTTPLDAVWNGIAEWFGVPSEELDTVLPNRSKFPKLFYKEDMFRDTVTSVN